jgi:hypothetical protein
MELPQRTNSCASFVNRAKHTPWLITPVVSGTGSRNSHNDRSGSLKHHRGRRDVLAIASANIA